MKRPSRFYVEFVTAGEQLAWIERYGDLWADTVEPETRTHVKDFDTEAEARAFLRSQGPDAPSGYCDALTERYNIRTHEEGARYGYEWDERDLDLWSDPATLTP
jgi:hypothetical protein